MKVSVALCTYNGEKYLEAQLASLVGQSRLPDELVVCDDGSTDQTWALLKQFAQTAPFAVHLHQNAMNMGVAGNFGRAISLCSGEIIFLCDQDDVWLPTKIARLVQALTANPQAGLAFSDGWLVDAHLQPLGMTLWQSVRLTRRRQWKMSAGRAAEVLMKTNYITGAALAFRSSYRREILPISPRWIHDYWIASLIGFYGPLIPVPEPLIKYRQHESNQIGQSAAVRPIVGSEADVFSLQRERYQLLYQRLLDLQARLGQLEDVPDRDKLMHSLKARIAHVQSRANLPESRLARLPVIAREVASGRYLRYSRRGLWSAFRDIWGR